MCACLTCKFRWFDSVRGYKMDEDIIGLNDIELYVKLLEARLELAMPEVHRQVKVYEDNLKNGTLKTPPNYNPLFNK